MAKNVRTVTIRNTSKKETFVDSWDGVEYRIKPGQTLQVPIHIAKHWMGDWELSGRERVLDLIRARIAKEAICLLWSLWKRKRKIRRKLVVMAEAQESRARSNHTGEGAVLAPSPLFV